MCILKENTKTTINFNGYISVFPGSVFRGRNGSKFFVGDEYVKKSLCAMQLQVKYFICRCIKKMYNNVFNDVA